MLLPSKVDHVLSTCVDPMRRVLTKYGYCVLVHVAARLHVPKELVRRVQLCSWQQLQLIEVRIWVYCQQYANVAIFLAIRLSVLETGASKDKQVYFSMRIVGARSRQKVDLRLFKGIVDTRQWHNSNVATSHHRVTVSFQSFLIEAV